jgi:hypothetical protein
MWLVRLTRRLQHWDSLPEQGSRGYEAKDKIRLRA